MSFNHLFKAFSYSAVFCGFLSLWISGSLSWASGLLYTFGFFAAWSLEGTRWQITERPGTALVVLAIPVYFVAWKFEWFDYPSSNSALPGFLARLILTLSVIKLLQKKSDRDWVFLYLMAFFQVLLAAGLSISASYLAAFIAYSFVMVCSIILLEMRRTSTLFVKESAGPVEVGLTDAARRFPLGNVPAAAILLIVLTACLAGPLFFLLPRVGGAGGGGTSLNGVSTYSGFSDSVRLGQIGKIQASDEVVMRVRLESPQIEPTSIRWRGVALDTFDDQSWGKSNTGVESRAKGDRDMIQVDFATGRDSLALQTFYLEPLDSSVLFALPRPVGVQGNFPVVFRDYFKSLSFQRPSERISYRVISDFSTPSENELRADRAKYSPEDASFLELPTDIDPRIGELTAALTKGSANRYDAARAVESFLQNNYGYTLEQKSGGAQPLADFLFNVKEGHCEYFSTALAIMLRTQGIATRVVNGFQRGEYNAMADVYVVRQKNAHSWVEVYFPGAKAWVTFDATPFAGRESTAGAVGITTRISGYVQALEAFWIEYFVAFDTQEQRTLFGSVKRGFSGVQRNMSEYFEDLQVKAVAWWSRVRGDNGMKTSLIALGWAGGIFLLLCVFACIVVWCGRTVVKSKVWLILRNRVFGRPYSSAVDFYDRMQIVLESKGYNREPHQTPLEFAFAISMPAVLRVTEKYNDVRFGGKKMSSREADEIETLLGILESEEAVGNSKNPL